MRGAQLFALTVCAALLCTSIGRALTDLPESSSGEDASSHRCVHDEVQEDIWADGFPRATTKSALATSPHTAAELADDDWQPIRIRFFVEDLKDPSRYCARAGQNVSNFQGGTVICQADDILTPAKNETLMNYLLPTAIELHRNRLLVQPVGNIVVPRMTSQTVFCYYNTIPESHHTAGVSDTDFVLYVSAGPAGGNVVAWASVCAANQQGKPLIGTMRISPQFIRESRDLAGTVAHEMLHALGFTFRVFNSSNMVQQVSVRGKPASNVLVSTNVVARAREQYGCDTMTFMELEDEGNDGTTSSHWDRRIAKDEMMAGIANVDHYTALTIAAMEDTGYYRGNYTNAEFMPWGYQAGCRLINEKCVINGVSQYPSMFCTDNETQYTCVSNRESIGDCRLVRYPTELPSYFQYFSDPTVGGVTEALMDYCPYVDSYSDTTCLSGIALADLNFYLGNQSRCFDVDESPFAFVTGTPVRAICAVVDCNGTDLTSYNVTFDTDTDPVLCTPGRRINLNSTSSNFTSGVAICPPREEVCRELFVQVVNVNSGSTAAEVSSSAQGNTSSSAVEESSFASATSSFTSAASSFASATSSFTSAASSFQADVSSTPATSSSLPVSSSTESATTTQPPTTAPPTPEPTTTTQPPTTAPPTPEPTTTTQPPTTIPPTPTTNAQNATAGESSSSGAYIPVDAALCLRYVALCVLALTLLL